jgi:hypothetical protein
METYIMATNDNTTSASNSAQHEQIGEEAFLEILHGLSSEQIKKLLVIARKLEENAKNGVQLKDVKAEIDLMFDDIFKTEVTA